MWHFSGILIQYFCKLPIACCYLPSAPAPTLCHFCPHICCCHFAAPPFFVWKSLRHLCQFNFIAFDLYDFWWRMFSRPSLFAFPVFPQAATPLLLPSLGPLVSLPALLVPLDGCCLTLLCGNSFIITVILSQFVTLCQGSKIFESSPLFECKFKPRAQS